MRRSMLILGAASLALTIAACDRNAPQNPPSAATPDEQAATPGAHPAATMLSSTDVTKAPNFVDKAAASDLFEIESSKIALQRSNDPAVKRFARMMIQAHTKTTKALKRTVADSGQPLSPPTALPSDLQAKLDDLNKASAQDFDKTYINDQIDGHQATLDVMQRYAQDGDVAPIKELAAKTAPTVQEHLTMAKSLKDTLDKSGGAQAQANPPSAQPPNG